MENGEVLYVLEYLPSAAYTLVFDLKKSYFWLNGRGRDWPSNFELKIDNCA